MSSRWMRSIRLPIRSEQFYQLPRHPAYKYEFLKGVAYITPRPRYYHAVLDLNGTIEPEHAAFSASVEFEAIPDDETEMVELFADGFSGVVPFVGLSEKLLISAAKDCLRWTRDGGDGTWLRSASYAARSKGQWIGAVYVTLLPTEVDLSRGDVWRRDDYPPVAEESGNGTPHLTWVFVSQRARSLGVGTALLQRSVTKLRHLGYERLFSTVQTGNEMSMLWHWRNGFRLCPTQDVLRKLRAQ